MPARRSLTHQPKRPRPVRAKSSRSLGVVFMLLNVLTWGAALPISKLAVEGTESFLFLLYRYGFAALFSLPLLIPLWRKFRPTFNNILEVVGLELLGITFTLGLLYWGLSLTSSLEASLLTMTIPVFVTLGGVLFLGERQDGNEWIGLLLALIGTLLLTFEPFLSGRTNGQLFTSFEGNLLILLSNITAGAYYLTAKRRYAKYPKLFASGLSFWVGAVSFLVIALLVTGVDHLVPTVARDLTTPSILWPSLYMGIFGSIIGLTAYIKGQDLMEASEASLFTYLQPIVTIPAAFLLHQEVPSTTMLLALFVILGGIALAELPKHRRRFGLKK